MNWLGRDPKAAALPEIPLVRLQRPGRPTVLIAKLLAVATALVVLALAVVPWRQSSVGQGAVVAFAPMDREQVVDAPVGGRVVDVHVVEGSTVKKGQPIVEIVDIDPGYVQRLETKRDAAQTGVEAAEDEGESYAAQVEAYEKARELSVRAARLKITMAKQRVRAAKQRVDARVAELDTAQLNLKRIGKLTEKGLSSQRSLELAELAVAKARTELNSAKAERSEAEANGTALEADLLRVDAEGRARVSAANAARRKTAVSAAEKRTDVAKLEIDLSRQESRIVRAPRDGTILRVTGNLGGQVISAGDPLAVLVPNTNDPAVELWIDGNDGPLVRPGRSVRLQFEGWPAVQFVGWPSVAVGTFGGKVAFVDATARADGRQRVVVVPDPSDDRWPSGSSLRQGARAKGWILLDEVRLGWELWRQFNGFPPTVQPPDDAKAGTSP